VALIGHNRDSSLLYDVKRFIRPINFRPGAITFEQAPGAPNHLSSRLMARLKEWTGQGWIVAIEGGGGAESAYDREQRERVEARKEVEADPFVRSVMATFPGAEIIEIRTIAAPVVDEATPPVEAEDDD